MNLETFFEKFDLFADVPDAVTKMRELVLQLAVQGKLVDQKLGDGDAPQLLSAISHERKAQAAKLRTPVEPAPADGDRISFPIPSTWAWTQLGNIALQIQYGYTASADPTTTDIRMLRITDIQNNRVDWPSVPGCQIELAEAEKYLLSSNDILIARTGGTIGKSFIVPDAPVKSVFASYLIRITPPQSMEARYLKIFLESPLYWIQLRLMSAGTGQPNVNGQALGRLEIPLPPLAEQKRIVAKVDELMALCDRLEMQQQERETRHAVLARASLARFADAPTPANLNFIFHKSYDIAPADLRKSILTLAVQGKLVLQDPSDEPAQELLARIQMEKVQLVCDGVLKRADENVDKESASPLLRLPAGWELVSLSELCTSITDGDHLPPPKAETGIPFLVISNVRWGRIDFSDTRYVGEDYFMKLDDIRKPRFGDILYTLVGSFGIPIMVNVDRPFCVQRHIGILRPSSEMSVRFLAYILESDLVFEQSAAIATGIAQKTIPLSGLRRVQLPLPPRCEQDRIVAKLDQLTKLLDWLQVQLAASSIAAEKLMEAMVTELTA